MDLNQPPASNVLRLATLNQWHWSTDRKLRLANQVQWLEREQIQVLCLQESSDGERSNTAAELADRSGYHLVTPPEKDGKLATTAILVNDPALFTGNAELVDLPYTKDQHARFAATALLSTSAGDLLVVTAHLAWGGVNEHHRLAQLQHLTEYVIDRRGSDDRYGPTILAGDFNAGPENESIRYLNGQTTHTPQTYWTDAHNFAQDDGITSDAANPYAIATALNYTKSGTPVLRPELIPSRRIDYIFSRGWRYGRSFTPTNTRVTRDLLLSDHYPVITDLLLTSE